MENKDKRKIIVKRSNGLTLVELIEMFPQCEPKEIKDTIIKWQKGETNSYGEPLERIPEETERTPSLTHNGIAYFENEEGMITDSEKIISDDKYVYAKDCPDIGMKTGNRYRGEYSESIKELLENGTIELKIKETPTNGEETKIYKTSTREVYDKFHNEYTYIVDYASILMDKHFPKGESKERSKALVFNGELIHYMMLVMNGVVEGLTDKKKGVDKGVDTKSQSGEREKEIVKWKEHMIKMFGVYHSDGQKHMSCPLCGINLEKLADYMIKELSESKKECIEVEKKKAILELSEEITKEVETIQEEYGDDIEVVHSMIDDLIVEKLGGELKEIYDGGWGWYA